MSLQSEFIRVERGLAHKLGTETYAKTWKTPYETIKKNGWKEHFCVASCKEPTRFARTIGYVNEMVMNYFCNWFSMIRNTFGSRVTTPGSCSKDSLSLNILDNLQPQWAIACTLICLHVWTLSKRITPDSFCYLHFFPFEEDKNFL